MNYKEAVSKKEVTQHIKTLKDRGWDYLGITGAGHHRMSWPHAPEGHGTVRFAATPSDPRWLSNSQKDAQNIEKAYPAPIVTPEKVKKEPSLWEVRFKMDDEAATAKSLERQKANEEKAKTPLSVQEKMRLIRQQMYKEKGL